MKRTFTFLIAMFCLMANANFSFAMREGGNDIVLRGELKPIGRSQSEPISASHDGSNLYVDFHADLGSLNITICNATGAVVCTENVVAQANWFWLVGDGKSCWFNCGRCWVTCSLGLSKFKNGKTTRTKVSLK